MLWPPASAAPLLAASIAPGPPPVMTEKPAWASAAPIFTPISYDGWSAGVRADPNTEMAGPISARSLKPSTNSAWIFSPRHGSVCTQSPVPRLSRRRWSLVLPSGRFSVGLGPLPLRLVIAVLSSVAGEPGAQHPLAVLDLRHCHVLVLLVGEDRVARPEVHRGDAERGEPGDVGPAELRADLAADGLDERPGRGPVEPRESTGSRVRERHLEAVEELADERQR